MPAATVAFVLVGLVLAATALGLLWRARIGRIQRLVPSAAVAIAGVELGAGATLLQFSTDVCAPCRATSRVLDELAKSTDAVAHVELDVTNRPELAARFHVLQTPTTLILDADGAIRARIGGAVRRDLVAAELDRVLGRALAA